MVIISGPNRLPMVSRIMIWGYPYTLCELMPTISASGAGKPMIFFGNLQHYYIGDRQQMTVARSEHVGFAQDKTFLRVLQREGWLTLFRRLALLLRLLPVKLNWRGL